MCGICGFVGARSDNVLRAMTAALVHRGPDGAGEFHDDALGAHLGHRRLAIIDLEGGLQPMANEDGSTVVVFNGEIYNHMELRAELTRLGRRLRTDHSDTEVLVHGYDEWGTDLLSRLNGMFAFAILDRRKGTLLLARDRFGEKPLYYAGVGQGFVFASEIGSLLLHPEVSRSHDIRNLQKYFAYGYVPAPNTIMREVYKLPAGSFLVYDIAAKRQTTQRYWKFRVEYDDGYRDEGALADELRHLLAAAVRRRLASDVPLGIFLSGGIDSSTVLALAGGATDPRGISTFTIGFTDPSFDESAYARDVAAHYGTRHHEKIMDFGTGRDLMVPLLSRIDEPFCDPSILPSYLLSEFARTRVTVALSGDGGDELFAGYDPFAALAASRVYRALVPGGLHRGLQRLSDMLPKADTSMSFDFKVRRWLKGVSHGADLWNPVWLAPLDPEQIREVFETAVAAEDLYSEAIEQWRNSASANIVDRTLEFYTNFYLTEDILLKADRASMLCSLESRAVFLDNDVADFCARLPARFKYRRGQRKYLLKKALAGLVPDRVLARSKKGFGIPLSGWLRSIPPLPPMKPVADIRLGVAADLWTAHRRRSADHRLFLWSWLALQYSPMLQTAS